jgi:hypothetical protein
VSAHFAYDELPPEHEQGEPPDDDEPDEVVCDDCRTTTLAIFSNGGRCQDCDAPVEEAVQAPLLERLKQAQVRAFKRWEALPQSDVGGRCNASLDCYQLRLWVDAVAKIEDGLRELEKRT